jgi:hypothetical protein
LSLEERIERLTSTVETLQTLVMDLITEQRQTRAEVKPKILRRADVAAMFGLTPEALRMALSRAKSGKGKLGVALLAIARNVGGVQCWFPSDIAAHCTRWIKPEGVDA